MVQAGTTIGHREDPNLVQILKEDQTGVLGPQAEVDFRGIYLTINFIGQISLNLYAKPKIYSFHVIF